MLPHIERIDPTTLKPEPVKTRRDRNKEGKRKQEQAENNPVPQPDEVEELDITDTESKHVIDIRI
jgi:hypothetical protein